MRAILPAPYDLTSAVVDVGTGRVICEIRDMTPDPGWYGNRGARPTKAIAHDVVITTDGTVTPAKKAGAGKRLVRAVQAAVMVVLDGEAAVA